jgi:hypothetical protein
MTTPVSIYLHDILDSILFTFVVCGGVSDFFCPLIGSTVKLIGPDEFGVDGLDFEG